MPDDYKLDDEDKDKEFKLDEDGRPPFSEPDDVPGAHPEDAQHPATDDNPDEDEAYQYGTNAAAGIRQEDERADEDGHGTRIA
ncbi:MAG TPA: hypothetical protein VJP80_02065 [Candidatus Saccharimonadales bacterium]|nr:hypothetical protein [Candidatus Saccharimonadales bacterium]